MAIQPDRDKYFRILKEKGLSAALTQLHEEMEMIEQDCFNAPGGYKPDVFHDLVAFRDFSRELWDFDTETKTS